MKLKSFTAKNFQSAKNITIEFPEKGVVMINGLNNSGKSGYLKDLGCMFYNNVPASYKRDYVRDNADYFEGYGTFYNTDKEIRYRRGSCNDYIIYENGVPTTPKPIGKLESAVPEAVKDLFNFYIDPVSKEKLNFRGSKDKLLLVTTSPKETYDILQYAIKTTEVNEGIHEGNAQIKEHEADINLNYQTMQALSDQLLDIDIVDTDSLEDNMADAEKLNTVIAESLTILSLTDKLNSIESCLCGTTDLRDDIQKLNTLMDLIEKLYINSTLTERLKEIDAALDVIHSANEEYEKLKEVYCVYSNAETIVTCTEKVNNIDSILKCNSDIQKELTTLTNSYELYKKLATLEECHINKEAIEKKIEGLLCVVPPDLYSKLSILTHCCTILENLAKYKSTVQSIKTVHEVCVKLETKKVDTFKKYGYCYTCKRSYD